MPRMLVGYCGNYCAKCPIYIASTTSNFKMKERLVKKYSRETKKKLSVDDIHCWGCRADNRNCWGKKCQFRKCAVDKGIEFCYQCSEFPCPDLDKHYLKFPDSQNHLHRICKVGTETFISEISEGGVKG